MKTKKLNREMRYDTPEKKYIKSIMYEFDFSTDIMIVESQQLDGSADYTLLHYLLQDGDKAYFSEEYLPAGMSKRGAKKPDITAIVENPAAQKAKWFIYDMKDTVNNVQTAGKLCSQWHEGIEHLKTEYLNTISDYQIENSVGVIMRYWSKDKLLEDIQKYRERLEGKNQLLTARKVRTRANEYAERIRAAQFIIDGIFQDYDELSGETEEYTISYIDLAKTKDLCYMAHMNIQL